MVLCLSIPQILCLVTLSAAAVAVSAVNDIDDYVGDFKHADSYRGAAGWLVFVGLAAVVYHAIMIFIRIIYFAANIGRSFAGFSFTVSNCGCHRLKTYVTGFAKTVPNGTRIEIQFIA